MALKEDIDVKKESSRTGKVWPRTSYPRSLGLFRGSKLAEKVDEIDLTNFINVSLSLSLEEHEQEEEEKQEEEIHLQPKHADNAYAN